MLDEASILLLRFTLLIKSIYNQNPVKPRFGVKCPAMGCSKTLVKSINVDKHLGDLNVQKLVNITENIRTKHKDLGTCTNIIEAEIIQCYLYTNKTRYLNEILLTGIDLNQEEEEEEELEFSSHYINTFSIYRGRKGETDIGYRHTWNSTTATLILVRARRTAPIHRIAILRPHPSDDDDEYDGYTSIQ